jgi:hypothetical protein
MPVRTVAPAQRPRRPLMTPPDAPVPIVPIEATQMIRTVFAQPALGTFKNGGAR